MNTTPRPAGPAPARHSHRARFAVAATVLMLAVTASTMLLGLLGARASIRIDLTATRDHELSAQSRAILSRLDRSVELVIAADFGALEPSVRQRTLDVLTTFQGASDRFAVTVIDTTSAEGAATYEQLLRRMADDAGPQVKSHQRVIDEALAALDAAAADIEAASESLAQIGAAVLLAEVSADALRALGKHFEGEADKARTVSAELREAATRARARLAEPAGPLPVPPLDSIARSLQSAAGDVAGNLSVLNAALDRFAPTPGVPVDAAQRATALARAVAQIRDRLARHVSALDQLAPLPILAVARTIQRSRAALLLAAPPAEGSPQARPGTPALAAIDVDALFPRPAPAAGPAGGASLDTRFRTEQLIAAGLATFTSQVRPRAVLVHAAPARLMPTLAPFDRTAARLDLRGIDCAEWPVRLDDHPPADPAPEVGRPARPVVYVIVWTPIRSAEDAIGLDRLSAAASRLVSDGKNVLLTLGPSPLPASGATDPMTDCLRPLGLSAATGLVLLREQRTVGGGSGQRTVAEQHGMLAAGANHVISAPADGAGMFFEWIVPLALAATPPEGVAIDPIVTIPVREGLWAESEWQVLWQTPPEDRARLPALPASDSPRDQAVPANSTAWWVAAAVQRSSPAFAATQRVVVVGAPTWFFPAIAEAQTVVDGRAAYAFPGNLELLHSSIAWLAGRDDLIARGAESGALAVVPDLSPARLRAVRLALILGLPLAVLLLGALWRAWRG